MEYGLLGEKLGHSFSPFIHSQLADYVYELCELPTPDAVRDFFRRREFRGVNVTIPYKKIALELCDEVDGAARAIGAVNTVVNDHGDVYKRQAQEAVDLALFKGKRAVPQDLLRAKGLLDAGQL